MPNLFSVIGEETLIRPNGRNPKVGVVLELRPHRWTKKPAPASQFFHCHQKLKEARWRTLQRFKLLNANSTRTKFEAP